MQNLLFAESSSWTPMLGTIGIYVALAMIAAGPAPLAIAARLWKPSSKKQISWIYNGVSLIVLGALGMVTLLGHAEIPPSGFYCLCLCAAVIIWSEQTGMLVKEYKQDSSAFSKTIFDSEHAGLLVCAPVLIFIFSWAADGIAPHTMYERLFEQEALALQEAKRLPDGKASMTFLPATVQFVRYESRGAGYLIMGRPTMTGDLSYTGDTVYFWVPQSLETDKILQDLSTEKDAPRARKESLVRVVFDSGKSMGVYPGLVIPKVEEITRPYMAKKN